MKTAGTVKVQFNFSSQIDPFAPTVSDIANLIFHPCVSNLRLISGPRVPLHARLISNIISLRLLILPPRGTPVYCCQVSKCHQADALRTEFAAHKEQDIGNWELVTTCSYCMYEGFKPLMRRLGTLNFLPPANPWTVVGVIF